MRNHGEYLLECLDSPAFVEKLRHVISEEGAHEGVIFAGALRVSKSCGTGMPRPLSLYY